MYRSNPWVARPSNGCRKEAEGFECLNDPEATRIFRAPIAMKSDIEDFGGDEGIVGLEVLCGGEYVELERSVYDLVREGGFECPFCFCKMEVLRASDVESRASDEDEIMRIILGED